MAATLESLDELTSWEGYRTFMKERLKQLPDGDVQFFISKEKVEFKEDGKPWKGYAVLLGPKGELAVKKLKKDGLQFREGSCRQQGKDFEVVGLASNFVKFAELTFKRLRLGYSVTGGVAEVEAPAEEEPQPAPEADELESRRLEIVADLKDAAGLRVDANTAVLKQAATRVRDVEAALAKSDFKSAERLLDEIDDLLTEIEEGPEPDAADDPDLAGLGDWHAYRNFMKAHLKRLPPEGGPFFVSRKKQEFSVDGKPFKGFAVLLGKKARITVQALKKEGTLFLEGTCTRKGKEVQVQGIPMLQIKGARKTFLKLRLGRKVVPVGEIPPDEAGDAGAARGAAGAVEGGVASPPKLSRKLLRMVQDVADALVKLRAACDELKKAGNSDEPYRKDFGTLTNALGAITQSPDSESDKEKKLKALKARVIEKTLDAKVANLDPKDAKSGPIIAKQIEARYGVKFKFSGKPKKEGETLKTLYMTLGKTPNFPKETLKKIEVTLKPKSATSEGGYYDPDEKLVSISCKRPSESLDYSNRLSPALRPFPDGVDKDCEAANSDPVNYFNWATLHEVGHAVDEKAKFMDGKEGDSKFAAWKKHAQNVKPIAQAVCKEFGSDLDEKGQKALEAYAEALMSRKTKREGKTKEEKDVKEWVDAVQVGSKLWLNGAESKKRAIGGRVYQEAYDWGGYWWASYDLAARRQGIAGYQFRAPWEWFAELYAGFYSKKLKASHPFVPELKALEKK